MTVKQRKRRRPRSSLRQSWRSREQVDGDDPGIPGTLVAHHGVAVDVRLSSGEVRAVKVLRRSGHVVGDRVTVVGERLRRGERDNELQRRDAMGRSRVVAANLDALGIVIAPVPPSPLGFLERALVCAAMAGISPFLVLNKSDLPEAELLEARVRRDWLEGASAIELPLFVVSADEQRGLDDLHVFFSNPPRRGAFIGTSGVGKSSLVNALLPEVQLTVGEINNYSGLGRHTTTTSTLHRLPAGGELVDTPGFRDFGLVDIRVQDLALHFPGFSEVLQTGACRFNDCRHLAEPDCAIKLAVTEGRLSAERHQLYRDVAAELDSGALPRG